ncbi:MAG: TIR domain-containing protein [Imperialibacter sp.]|uniref:TIR domain-containing protein n=1 Tax=Imperialibacter sp. TaxID=2038411 RepID=UPI0032ED0A93
MGLLDWLFGVGENRDVRRKKVFISFAIEDVQYRNYLVDQAREKHSPFDFIDMSVKKKWNQREWKDKCRRKIKRCDGVIALLSKNTHMARGARWEMKCAVEEDVKIIGMHIFKDNKGAIPKELKGKRVIEWSWNNLEKVINKL